jgi:hypothetical protein
LALFDPVGTLPKDPHLRSGPVDDLSRRSIMVKVRMGDKYASYVAKGTTRRPQALVQFVQKDVSRGRKVDERREGSLMK